MNSIEPIIKAIRNMHTEFRVTCRNSQKIELECEKVIVNEIEGKFIFEFESPARPWAMEWSAIDSKWVNRPELSNPVSGLISEAFIKSAGDNYTVSFSDLGSPLVRWGFTASSVSARPL